MRLHRGERPFKCDQCEETFARIGCMKYHKKTSHTYTSVKCNKCSKIFHWRLDFDKHEEKCTADTDIIMGGAYEEEESRSLYDGSATSAAVDPDLAPLKLEASDDYEPFLESNGYGLE